MGKMKTVDFSETIAASDMKVSRSSHLIEYGPQHEKMSLQTKFLISKKQVRFEIVMFPKSNSFYLTRLFKA